MDATSSTCSWVRNCTITALLEDNIEDEPASTSCKSNGAEETLAVPASAVTVILNAGRVTAPTEKTGSSSDGVSTFPAPTSTPSFEGVVASSQGARPIWADINFCCISGFLFLYMNIREMW